MSCGQCRLACSGRSLLHPGDHYYCCRGRTEQAQRQTLRNVLAQLERQQTQLLDLYLAEVIERDEVERKRKEVTQTQHGLTQQLRQLDAQAQQYVDLVGLAQGIGAFCRHTQPTLDD